MTLMLTDFTKNILRLYFTGTARWANTNYKFILMKNGETELYYKCPNTSTGTGMRTFPMQQLFSIVNASTSSTESITTQSPEIMYDRTLNTDSKTSLTNDIMGSFYIQPIDKNEIDVNDVNNLSLDTGTGGTPTCFKNPSSLKWITSSVNGLGTIKITAVNNSATNSATVNRLVILSSRNLKPEVIYYKSATVAERSVSLHCMPLAYVDIDSVTVAPGETYIFQIHIPAIEMQTT